MKRVRSKRLLPPPQPKQLDWFRIGGSVLGVWAVVNTTLSIARYGIETGFYWWFCNLALIGMAGGLAIKHRGWITGFLSISLFTQVFWVIDNQYRLFTGKNLFGLAEFMFQPGLPLDEFILSHYHYLTIPIGIIALVFLPRGKSNAIALISIFNPLIFGVSYFLFPKMQNINCIHEPCFPNLQHWAGPTYSLVFWVSIFAMHLLIGYGIETLFLRVKLNTGQKFFAKRVFLAVITLTIVIAGWDVHYKMSLPSFTCENGQWSGIENQKGEGSVAIECGYTLDYSPGVMLFHYRVINNAVNGGICRTSMDLGNTTVWMDDDLKIGKKATVQSQVLVPYPTQSVIAKLGVECEAAKRGVSKE